VDSPPLGDERIRGIGDSAVLRLDADGAPGLNRTARRGAESKDGGGHRGGNQ
jgi:hypothetical protein